MVHSSKKQPLLVCEAVSLGYENKSIMENLSFSLEEGDYLGVIGENGAGKSTFIKSLLGLIKPISGTMTWQEGIRRVDIGYLPQQTLSQKDFPATVYEVVCSGLLNKSGLWPFYKKQQKEVALSNMQKLHIEDLKGKCYRELSGGQQQRVLLARALCAASKVLVLDEPVTNLDPAATDLLYENLRKLHKEGMTIIMVSHDINNLLKESNKILHMKKLGCFYGMTSIYSQSEMSRCFAGGERG